MSYTSCCHGDTAVIECDLRRRKSPARCILAHKRCAILGVVDRGFERSLDVGLKLLVTHAVN